MDYSLAKKLADAGYPQEKGMWGFVDIPEKVKKTPRRTFVRAARIQRFPWIKRRAFDEAKYPVVLAPGIDSLIEEIGNERVVQAIIDREIVMIDTKSLGELWLALKTQP